MKKSTIFGALALLSLGGAALATSPSVIDRVVGVCDVNAPTHCAAPDASGNIPVTIAPTTGTVLTPVYSLAAEASHQVKTGQGNLYAYQVTTGGTAGYVMLFDMTVVPADGAVTPVKCVQVPANSTVGISNFEPETFANGILMVFSSTGCFTKTASATAYFSADAK